MERKKILMLINFFPPAGGGGVYRPLSFVKYLARLSWDVTVVSPKPGEFWISDPGLEGEIPPEVRVVRTSSLSAYRLLGLFGRGRAGGPSSRSSGSFERLRRLGEMFLVPDTYVGWVPFAVRAASRLCRAERFDILYSTSPPDSTHLAAMRLARRFSIPWVADFRDPWISLYLRDPPTPLHRSLHMRMEARVAGADRVLVTTSWQERKLSELYPRCRVVKIPNGYDGEDFDSVSGCGPPPGPFTILHCGMLTQHRTSRPFLEGLSLLLRREPGASNEIRAVFVGARESGNERWVKRLGLEGLVTFRDNLPHNECVELERKSHVLLLVKHDDERYRGLVPGKLFEYIGARRPILAVVPDGEASGIVTELRRGEVAGIGDPEGIADKIWKMFVLYRDGKLESHYSLDEVRIYSRKEEAGRLNEILEGLLAGK